MSKSTSNRPPRQSRRDQFTSTKPDADKPWWTVAATFVLAAGLLLAVAYSASTTRSPGAVAPAPVNPTALSGDVRLDASQFADGKARFFDYRTVSGKAIRFFVLKSSDGVIRAALDTCEVCYRERKGYRQVGDSMVCNNCDKVFPSGAINVSQGGCNPVPLQRTVDGTQVLLSASALETGVAYF